MDSAIGYQTTCKECGWVGTEFRSDDPKTPTRERAKNKADTQYALHRYAAHERQPEE